MALTVREMAGSEIDILIEYFLGSTPEHLEILGVDRSRMTKTERLRERFARERALPIEQRAWVVVIWLLDDRPIGFFDIRQHRLWRASQHAPARR